MKIKNTFVAFLLASVAAFAQQQNPTFTVTTLSAAINSTATIMTVASATGFTANTTVAQIEDEVVGIAAVSGTTITIRRGQNGTRAANHASGSAVRVAAPQNFSACPGVSGTGVGCGILYNQAPLTTRYSSGPFFPTTTPATVTTAGAVTYTAGQLLNGIILRDPNGSGRTDVLPTAALLVAAIPGVTVGTTFDFWIRNDADAAETITIQAGTGGSVSGTATIAQNNSKMFRLRFTAVDSGNEAYTVYSLGTAVF